MLSRIRTQRIVPRFAPFTTFHMYPNLLTREGRITPSSEWSIYIFIGRLKSTSDGERISEAVRPSLSMRVIALCRRMVIV